jgi:hypothetical protein
MTKKEIVPPAFRPDYNPAPLGPVVEKLIQNNQEIKILESQLAALSMQMKDMKRAFSPKRKSKVGKKGKRSTLKESLGGRTAIPEQEKEETEEGFFSTVSRGMRIKRGDNVTTIIAKLIDFLERVHGEKKLKYELDADFEKENHEKEKKFSEKFIEVIDELKKPKKKKYLRPEQVKKEIPKTETPVTPGKPVTKPSVPKTTATKSNVVPSKTVSKVTKGLGAAAVGVGAATLGTNVYGESADVYAKNVAKFSGLGDDVYKKGFKDLTPEQQEKVMDSITKQEGGHPRDINMRLNNPGNIVLGKTTDTEEFLIKRAKTFGSRIPDLKTDVGTHNIVYAHFDSLSQGRQVMRKMLLSPQYADRTVAQQVAKWLGAEKSKPTNVAPQVKPTSTAVNTVIQNNTNVVGETLNKTSVANQDVKKNITSNNVLVNNTVTSVNTIKKTTNVLVEPPVKDIKPVFMEQ